MNSSFPTDIKQSKKKKKKKYRINDTGNCAIENGLFLFGSVNRKYG